MAGNAFIEDEHGDVEPVRFGLGPVGKSRFDLVVHEILVEIRLRDLFARVIVTSAKLIICLYILLCSLKCGGGVRLILNQCEYFKAVIIII